MGTANSSRETCVLSILRKESSASTKQMIELASTPEFRELCRDCKSGVEVYDTATKLLHAGLIERHPGRDGFVWSITKHAQPLDSSMPPSKDMRNSDLVRQ
jgi:hypothetical protein